MQPLKLHNQLPVRVHVPADMIVAGVVGYLLVTTEAFEAAAWAQLEAEPALGKVVSSTVVSAHDGFDAEAAAQWVLKHAETVAPLRVVLALPNDEQFRRDAIAERLATLGVDVEEILIGTRAMRPAALAHTSPLATLSNARAAEEAVAELVDREPYQIDRDAVGRVLTGKRVLITGAGGSIGSHLVDVVASFAPESITLVERSENALFEIDQRLGRSHPNVTKRAVLHDVVDVEGTKRLFEDVRPAVVLHAAAHKHVPLMEDHPGLAITNNVFGTIAVADAAKHSGAERFVLISSDKAVNPTSVMGATKRLAEMYVRSLGADATTQTACSMVRFGNVLGSAGSVLTVWANQIAEGGPVTVTDPRMTRYFMTIPEAATLVVQSMALDAQHEGSGVFVLDMGEPVRIVDLAKRFVTQRGGTPFVEDDDGVLDQRPPVTGPRVDVVFSGIRPGEKLHEELAYAAESLGPTDHPGIRVWRGVQPEGGIQADAEWVASMLADLGKARFATNRDAVIAAIRTYVPEMRAADVAMGDN